MSEPQELSLPPPDHNDPLVSALRELRPAPADLNRDGLMYAAGAESRRGVVRLWQAAAGFLAAVGFAAGMLSRPGGYEREKIVYVDRQVPASALPAPEPQPVAEPDPPPVAAHRAATPTPYARAWLRLRSDLLAAGLSVLPDPPAADKP